MHSVLTTSRSGNTVRILESVGADLNLKNNEGDTALHIAVKNSNRYSTENTVRLLVAAGADLDEQNNYGWTALQSAVYNHKRHSSDKTVRILLEAGADPNIKNRENKTALNMTKDLSLQLLLVKAGAKIDYHFTNLIKFKINELKLEIAQYKRLLNDLELELVQDNKNCNHQKNNIEGIENLEKCVKTIKQMIKLRPEGKKVKKMVKKYIQTEFNKIK